MRLAEVLNKFSNEGIYFFRTRKKEAENYNY